LDFEFLFRFRKKNVLDFDFLFIFQICLDFEISIYILNFCLEFEFV
jgi:hypothetical protein